MANYGTVTLVNGQTSHGRQRSMDGMNIAGYFAWGCISLFSSRHYITTRAYSISTEGDCAGQDDVGRCVAVASNRVIQLGGETVYVRDVRAEDRRRTRYADHSIDEHSCSIY